MIRVDSIGTPRDVAVWLSTDPDPHAVGHAFDSLVDAVGHDQALATWGAGVRLHHTKGQRG